MVSAALNGYVQRHIPCHVFILPDIDRLLEVAACDHIVRSTGILGNGFEQNAAIKGAAVDHSIAICQQRKFLRFEICSAFIPTTLARNGNGAAVDLHRSHRFNRRTSVCRLVSFIHRQRQLTAVQCQLRAVTDQDHVHSISCCFMHTDNLATALGVLNDQVSRCNHNKRGRVATR